MDGDVWASIVATVVVPLVLRVLVHYFPWLAEAVTPEQPHPGQGTQATPSAPEIPTNPQEGAEGA